MGDPGNGEPVARPARARLASVSAVSSFLLAR